MQIQQPRKTYHLRSAAPVPPAITAPTKCTSNIEKENVKPKSSRVKVPTKTVGKPKPVEEVDLTATTEEDEVVKGNSDFVTTGAIVNNAKKRQCKPTVVVSDSVVTQPLVPQVPALDTTYKTPAEAVKSRKRKVGVVSAKVSEVVQSRKCMQVIVVSNPVSLTKTDTVDTI